MERIRKALRAMKTRSQNKFVEDNMDDEAEKEIAKSASI
jgi:hypothetical protein